MNVEVLQEKITELGTVVKDLKAEIKSVKSINGDIKELCMNIRELAIEMKYMKEAQSKHEERITALEQKPIKKMDTISTTILSGIVGTVLGIILTMIGLK